MSVATVYAPAYFAAGNNSTSTAYVCPWKAVSANDLRVVETLADGTEQAALSNGSGLTVTLVGNTVEFTTTAAIPATSSVAAFLTSDFLQSVDLQNSGNSDVNVREDMFDKLTILMQIALAGVSETAGIPIAFPTGEDTTTQTLPTAPNRASSFIYFDTNGDLTTYLYATLISDIIELINTGGGDAATALANRVTSFSTDKTLANSDMFRLWDGDASGGDITVTCPADSAATIPIGSKVDITKSSAGNNILFAAGAGATLQSASGATPQIDAQYGGATAVKVAANTWRIFGRITAQ